MFAVGYRDVNENTFQTEKIQVERDYNVLGKIIWPLYGKIWKYTKQER